MSNPVPASAQQSSYWLQLPYRYSLPLLGGGTLLQYFISQSLFITRFDYNYHGVQQGPTLSGLTYSLRASVPIFVLSCVFILVAGLSAARWYAWGSICVGSCSAAISAACHPLQRDDEAWLGRVQWGTEVDNEGEELRREVGGVLVGRCCISSREVGKLVGGRLYA